MARWGFVEPGPSYLLETEMINYVSDLRSCSENQTRGLDTKHERKGTFLVVFVHINTAETSLHGSKVKWELSQGFQ